MTDSLRRSARRNNKKRTYSVGDIVDIVEGIKANCKGKLISKCSELTLSQQPVSASGANSRWLVVIEDDTEDLIGNELCESSFGEVVGKMSQDELSKALDFIKATKKTTGTATAAHTIATPISSPSPNTQLYSSHGKSLASSTAISSTVAVANNSVKDGVSSSNNPHQKDETASQPLPLSQDPSNSQEENNKKRKSRSSSPSSNTPSANNNNQSDASTPSSDLSKKAARASAREERSRRRQALMEDELNRHHHVYGGAFSMGYNTKGKNGRLNKKKKLNPRNGTDVVQVPMLTGILYLYRGIPRRAEFVRKL